MGTGSSKSGSQPIAVNTAREATESEHRTHDRKEAPNLIESQVQVAKSNMEKEHDKPSQVPDTTAENNNEPSKGEGNLNQSATDTVVVNGPTQITMEETVNHLREVDSEAASLLVSFCEQYPDVKVSLSKTMVYSRGLKEALDDGNMISPKTVELAKGLFDVYLKCKKPRNKAGVTDFAVRLEIPKLFCDTITHLRTKYPELTKWDRIKDLEKKETEETADNDQDERQDTVENERANELIIAQDVVNNLGAAALNFSDLHGKFCLESSEAGMVTLFVEIIKELEDSVAHNARFVNAETQRLTKYTTRGKMLSRLMGALHNLSKRVPVRSSFSACGAVEVLIPFLKAEVTLYATKALLILAYLIDEENNHLIMADEGPIKFLTKTLDRSLRMTHHRFLGFSSAELAEGLTQIALNDSNKKMIAHCGAIPILSKMLRTAKENEEKINGCNTLWTLAFDAENRQEIKNDQSAVTELRKLASDENSEVRKAAGGALWEIEGKEKHSEKTPPTTAGTGAEEIADTKHIMISYQWDVQSSMVQLKNKLQAEGFKVWMDVDEMGGSTLESMAKAVENASVVLIGVSQKYKESPNCRSEAEYTFQLHRDIIPLMMEKKYKPDGWLGMVVGTKFWIDFSDRYKLDSNVDKLKKELGNRGSLKVQEHVQVATVDVVDAAPRPSINSWKNSEAKQWLVDSGLQKRMNQKAVERLDGPMLIRMQDLRKESPEFFYSTLRQDFGLVNVFDVLEFTDALDKLVG